MKLFNIILGLTALLVAGCSAFFSIKGIGLLFSGSAISVMVMATSLEIGKIVSTSFLYRYWNQTTKFLKIYLLCAIIILMGVTSLGVFGFLTAAYQKSSSEFGIYTQQIQTLESQKSMVTSQIESIKKRLDSLNKLREQQEDRLNKNNDNQNRRPSDIKKIQDTTVELIKQTVEEIKKTQESLQKSITQSQEYDSKILELKINSQHSKDILTFQFIADAFHMDLNTVVKWFILIIIFVFDPLAVCLVLSYNVAVYGQMNHLDEKIILNRESDIKHELKKPDIKTPIIDLRESNDIECPIPPINNPIDSTVSVEGNSTVLNEKVTIEEPIINAKDKFDDIKPFSKLSDDEKIRMTEDQLIRSVEKERGQLRQYEYFNSPTR